MTFVTFVASPLLYIFPTDSGGRVYVYTLIFWPEASLFGAYLPEWTN